MKIVYEKLFKYFKFVDVFEMKNWLVMGFIFIYVLWENGEIFDIDLVFYEKWVGGVSMVIVGFVFIIENG